MSERKRIKEKGRSLGNIKTVIYGRTFLLMLAFLAQLGLLVVGYVALRNYSLAFYALFLAVSAVAVIYIYNTAGNPDMKLSWMFAIAILPIFGAVFYATITVQRGPEKMHRKLVQLRKQTREDIVADREVWDSLRHISPNVSQLAFYLYHTDFSPAYMRTAVKYYPLGDVMFPDMLETLRSAKEYIFIEFFIISEGRMWTEVHEILKEKVAEGVEVRLMYDGTDVLFNLPNNYPAILRSEGISCKMFAPIKPIFSPHYNNRDHRKVLVVDGKIAFTGGINLADEYINEKERFGHWKDTGLRLEGDAVERFIYMFLEMWNVSESEGEDFSKYAYNKENGKISDGYVIPYSVMPLGSERVGERVYLDILNTAHTYVHIMTPYLILDYQMMMGLKYAATRGVEVVIVMPHIPDKKYAFSLAKTYYNELLEAGVRIMEYEPGFVHAKVFVADDNEAVVGTVNLDYRSLYHHFECATYLYRSSQIAEIEKDMQETFAKCIEIKPEDYAKLPLGDRACGRLLRIVAPLM